MHFEKILIDIENCNKIQVNLILLRPFYFTREINVTEISVPSNVSTGRALFCCLILAKEFGISSFWHNEFVSIATNVTRNSGFPEHISSGFDIKFLLSKIVDSIAANSLKNVFSTVNLLITHEKTECLPVISLEHCDGMLIPQSDKKNVIDLKSCILRGVPMKPTIMKIKNQRVAILRKIRKKVYLCSEVYNKEEMALICKTFSRKPSMLTSVYPICVNSSENGTENMYMNHPSFILDIRC